MPKYEEIYDEKKQSGSPTITMTNEQLQLMITGIVNGLRPANQSQVGSPVTPTGQQVNNATPPDRLARSGSGNIIRPFKRRNLKYTDYSKITSDDRTVQQSFKK